MAMVMVMGTPPATGAGMGALTLTLMAAAGMGLLWTVLEAATTTATPGRLAAELNDVYDTIRTLQTEHSLGRIGEADFRAQLDEYRRRAARILRALEGGAGGGRAGGDGEGERGG